MPKLSNRSETEFILIGLREQLMNIPDPSISLNLENASIHTFTKNSSVCNLCVIFDKNLSFSNHITRLTRICFMHICDLRRIRPMPDIKTASTIATSIVHTKLDYSKSHCLNTYITQINRLEAIQNALACAVTNTDSNGYSSRYLLRIFPPINRPTKVEITVYLSTALLSSIQLPFEQRMCFIKCEGRLGEF